MKTRRKFTIVDDIVVLTILAFLGYLFGPEIRGWVATISLVDVVRENPMGLFLAPSAIVGIACVVSFASWRKEIKKKLRG